MTHLLVKDAQPRDAVPVSPRRAQTLEKLMAAAVSVFAARGIFGSSVEEICEAAGFTRGAFYSNFADKDELVLALIRREIETQYAAAERAIAAMKTAVASGAPPETLVSTALAAFEEFASPGREGTLARQELLLYAAREPAVREPYRLFAEECLKQFTSLIQGAIASAGLEFTVDFPDAIALLTATHSQVHMDALFTGGELDSRPLRVLLLAITRPIG